MSETSSDAKPAAADEPAAIDFERADLSEPAPSGRHVECGLCKRSVATEYWQYLGKVLCENCRGIVERTVSEAREGATFGKAFLLAGGAAFGCGIGYAIFVGVTGLNVALITIGIGWAVGRTIQRVTRGFGSRKHQVLAVALTYFATSMGYLAPVYRGINEGARKSHAAQTAAAPTATVPAEAPPAGSPPPSDTPAPAPPRGPPPNMALSLVFTLAVIGVFTLAAPLIEIAGGGFSGLIGLLIIFFGMQTAWRVSKGVEAPITGPHRVAPATA